MQNALQVKNPPAGGVVEAEGDAQQYLTFLLGREMFAIPILGRPAHAADPQPPDAAESAPDRQRETGRG